METPVVHAENAVPMIPMDPYSQQSVSLPPTSNSTSQIDQEFTQINQQIHDLSLRCQNPTYEYENVGTGASYNQPLDANAVSSYGDNQYALNSYEPLEQTDYYGQPQQHSELPGSIATGYPEQPTQQSYQTPTYNEPQAYGASNYGTNEVNARFTIIVKTFYLSVPCMVLIEYYYRSIDLAFFNAQHFRYDNIHSEFKAHSYFHLIFYI